MSTATKPPPRAPKVNRIGLQVLEYKGGKTTLCAGCGHNSISQRIIECFFEMGVQPYQVAKFSGIGCSSKSPAYFLSQSHGFNGVHGRAPAISTGALLANHTLVGVVTSGDGDTASIGLGNFMHMLRRNFPMIYIIENNGVYGLTKGQFSATADVGSKLKSGLMNDLSPIDCCLMGIEMGASFIARSFAGDKNQLKTILQAAISHRGMAVLDIISPCTTFNDHDGSTKSYSYMQEHDEPLHDLDFVPFFADIEVEIDEGEVREVELHDGSTLRLKKLERDYDPTDKFGAITAIHEAEGKGEVLTGLIYVDSTKETFIDSLDRADEPLGTLPESKTRPSKEALEALMEDLR
ncbi:MAG: 2-oxoacid:ferredoxin oxidoreductase subunit beta [bacterium]|nr:2-oxoacid:ferredoxin oxidoreductase subunit beta [bacterium]